MSNFPNRGFPTPVSGADMAVDSGLRSFMLGVYNQMFLGLMWAGAVAYAVMQVPEVRAFVWNSTPGAMGPTMLGMVVMFAPLALMFISNFMMRNPSPTSASILFWTWVTLSGASFGIIGAFYSPTAIAQAFLVTSIAFGALSLFGYTTKTNLSGFHSFLVVGIVGLIAASLLNAFVFKSPMLDLVVSAVGVFIFAGLIATQTQGLREMYYHIRGDERTMAAMQTMGALSLYLSFINLFQLLLRLFGGSRD